MQAKAHGFKRCKRVNNKKKSDQQPLCGLIEWFATEKLCFSLCNLLRFPSHSWWSLQTLCRAWCTQCRSSEKNKNCREQLQWHNIACPHAPSTSLFKCSQVVASISSQVVAIIQSCQHITVLPFEMVSWVSGVALEPKSHKCCGKP